MRKVLGLLTALLLASPVKADDVAADHIGYSAWVHTKSDQIYFFSMGSSGSSVCKKADIR